MGENYRLKKGAEMKCRTYLNILAMLVLLTAPLFPAHAQQAGNAGETANGSSGTSGGIAGPQGRGVGGTTAGAGTVSNSGTSSGPGGVNQNRYGGRANQPAPDQPQEGEAATEQDNQIASQGQDVIRDMDFLWQDKDWCGGFDQSELGGKARLRGKNKKRLEAVQKYVAPYFNPQGDMSGIRILAAYQEEFGKIRPDAHLAGVYLGLVSAGTLTEKDIENINALLCITISQKQMRAIVRAVEEMHR